MGIRKECGGCVPGVRRPAGGSSGGLAKIPAGIGNQLIGARAHNGVKGGTKGNACLYQCGHYQRNGLVFGAAGLCDGEVQGLNDARVTGEVGGCGGVHFGGSGHVRLCGGNVVPGMPTIWQAPGGPGDMPRERHLPPHVHHHNGRVSSMAMALRMLRKLSHS